jgi:serine protease AprX
VIGSNKREIVVNNPEAGQWTIEIRGARGLTAAPQASSPVQVAAPGPADGTVTQVKYILPSIPDISGHPKQAEIEAAIKNRVIDIYPDGTFRPASTVTREDLARSLVSNSSLRQSLGSTPKFNDVSGDLLNITEAVTAKGSTLRDYDFVPNGMVAFSGTSFQPATSVNRLDLAVALVRALGHDAAARSLSGSTVTSGGVPLTDNAQIPSALRGYVQLAIDKGIFEAFPAQVIQTGPGQFLVLPGPRFEPATTINRADFAGRLNSYRTLFSTGG